MKVYGPDFFKDFHCIGSECRDNCCKMGWDIEIDDETYRYYRSLGCGLYGHISDDGGEHYIKQQDGQCPFLDENGLCSVVLKYGEEHISEICTEHPRFYRWFGDYKEAGTGLCCEESVRLWLSHAGSIGVCEWQTDEESDDLDFDPVLLKSVLGARTVLIGLFQNSALTLSQKLKALLIFGLNTQQFTESDAAEGFDELAEVFADTQRVKELLGELGGGTDVKDRLKACGQVIGVFERLDYLKSVFPHALDGIKGRLGEITDSTEAFGRAFPEVEDQLCAVAVYNIFRYLPECVYGEQFLPIAVGCILNVWFLKLWGTLLWLDGKYSSDALADAVREYSKEIEYSDNTAELWECVYTDSRLCADNIRLISEV